MCEYNILLEIEENSDFYLDQDGKSGLCNDDLDNLHTTLCFQIDLPTKQGKYDLKVSMDNEGECKIVNCNPKEEAK